MYLVDVERRIRHDVVELSRSLERIFVVGVRLADLSFQSVHREVHLAQANRLIDPLLAIDGKASRLAVAVLLHEPRALDEHASRPTCGIEDLSAEWFDDLDDQPDDRCRREVLPALRAFRNCELA
jgi:hypothetical protein